jgi:hypothetical protein
MAYEEYIKKRMEMFPKLKEYYQQCLDSYKDGKIVPGACRGLKCICGTCSCFIGTDLVRMVDGSNKEVASIVKGDVVYGGFKVVCKIEFMTSNNTMELVKIPYGPTLTPWHPVCIGSKWCFPADIYPVVSYQCFQVFNFIFDLGHLINVNGYDCITMGHGYTVDPVLRHPYFGSQRVVDDMKKLPGFSEGHVVIVDAQVERDDNGLVSRIF